LARRENDGPKFPQLLVTRLTQKRRRPCFGWISSDEEDEEDLIQITPSTPISKISDIRENGQQA